jgi:hypothetical protein
MAANSPDIAWEEKKALIIGRASPEPSKKHIETVCTGGITESGELLRLYPIPLRYLEATQKYKLWTWAKFDVLKNSQDRRKESYKVREDSITVLSHVATPAERFSLLKKGIVRDRETLDQLYHSDWTSMGVVEIEFIDLTARMQRKNWEKDKPYIKQFHLYIEKKPLEQLPLDIRLRFRCKHNPACSTHVSTLIGWEYMEAFRSFRYKYGSGLNAFNRIKEALESRFSDPTKSSYALMGTHHKYGSWMVAQIYFFDKDLPPTLF